MVDTPAASAAPLSSASRRRATASQRIIAAGVIVAACIWASSVIMTLIFALLAAYLLDPAVVALEKLHVPRALGALLVLLCSLLVVSGLGYLAVNRLDEFGAEWPRYSSAVRKITTSIDQRLEHMEKRVSEIAPAEKPAPRVISVEPAPKPVHEFLYSGIGSIYSTVFLLTFVPFVVFFMLASKRAILRATLGLFPATKRSRVEGIFSELNRVLRGYVAGFTLVAAILVLSSWIFFWAMGLANPFLAGAVSGFLNLIPYIGAVLAWIPPMVIALTRWHSVGPFVGIAAALMGLHILALNLLIPAIVGRHVHVNALTVTMALLFWGWLWGIMGLVLAIPIVAAVKVICDRVEGWEPVGRWLGST